MKYKNQPVKTIQVLFWGESDLLCEFKGPLDIWKRKSPVPLPDDLPEWMEVLGKDLFIQPKGAQDDSKGE